MAHIHEKIDFTVSVYIVFNNTVLLHDHRKYNMWLPPGGHIELEEDPNEAALREVKEETGLEIELIGNPMGNTEGNAGRHDLIPPKFLNRHFVTEERTHEHLDLIYFGRANSNAVVMEDNRDYKWLSREEIEKNDLNMESDVRTYALKALEELGL